MSPDEREEREAVFDSTVSDPEVRRGVYRHVSFITGPGEPAVAPADVAAARHYLKRCMSNMTLTELATKTSDEFAALWALGALGAARYRVRHRPPSARRSGPD
jgi:hypothetical protein